MEVPDPPVDRTFITFAYDDYPTVSRAQYTCYQLYHYRIYVTMDNAIGICKYTLNAPHSRFKRAPKSIFQYLRCLMVYFIKNTNPDYYYLCVECAAAANRPIVFSFQFFDLFFHKDNAKTINLVLKLNVNVGDGA